MVSSLTKLYGNPFSGSVNMHLFVAISQQDLNEHCLDPGDSVQLSSF